MAKINLERIQDLISLTRRLAVVLRTMDFINNFDSFETEISITAGAETRILNALDSIPTKYIIVDQTGNGLVTRGNTDWNSNNLYLKNNGANDVTIKVIFFK